MTHHQADRENKRPPISQQKTYSMILKEQKFLVVSLHLIDTNPPAHM